MTTFIILVLVAANLILSFVIYRKVSGSSASLREILSELYSDPGSILKRKL